MQSTRHAIFQIPVTVRGTYYPIYHFVRNPLWLLYRNFWINYGYIIWAISYAYSVNRFGAINGLTLLVLIAIRWSCVAIWIYNSYLYCIFVVMDNINNLYFAYIQSLIYFHLFLCSYRSHTYPLHLWYLIMVICLALCVKINPAKPPWDSPARWQCSMSN